MDMGRAGDASVSGLWRVDSARVYSLAARNQGLTTTQRAILTAAGYPDGPGPTSVFFGDRGSEEFAGYGVLDMSFNYNVPVFRSLRPVGEVRHVQPVQQPEVDRLEHDDQPGSRQSQGQPGLCDRLRQGPDVRDGDG